MDRIPQNLASSLSGFLLLVLLSSPLLSQAEPFLNKQSLVQVTNTAELYQALARANRSGYTDIQLAPGRYMISQTLNISAANIKLIGTPFDPSLVTLQGLGMRASPRVENIIRVSAKHFTLDGLTLSDAGNHLVQIAGEQDADFPVIKNCILQDGYQQLLKVSSSQSSTHSSDYGIVENCEFKYTAGIGPSYYIGGIDAHGARGWTVRNNTFRDIASPDKRVAEFAIHFWNGATNTTVENNRIINCDRGIGFGLQGRPAKGGAIINNLIVHQDIRDPSSDVGIILEQTPDTQILDNRIFLAHGYPNAIEYRFKETNNVVIMDNISNKKVQRRDGAAATLYNNKTITLLDEMLTPQEQKLLEPSDGTL